MGRKNHKGMIPCRQVWNLSAEGTTQKQRGQAISCNKLSTFLAICSVPDGTDFRFHLYATDISTYGRKHGYPFFSDP